ncbi:WAS/WASL-interacting protein family member 1-like [Orcinus orca]|uniref:WAS/WASL-interacting protein family member 1-like n=1 Tax=Orcinus orca TaxID=9733 RepID=UPI0021137F39|nr:WAS/WASL-interacting protein family member 1-like [Orcinus orca]XP_049556676.1 WAS/WASL-interacting protein family member 1-like [Orcinus orca]XP_049556677.1 WAS/WASL-interacting protein family member 1-like [Orcinus orca]XP_049556678.1 WAS/WASL-interacting protein family member 1-like [Orcinus orca]XP_049556679.1 WAS/WASL-interacting protein family member 1-like [Orcinus orca]XP_049556680.1 WAS/WASL-interacting protein family member 1-like [Orcinus orca]XP_049556681.1 WAS/WASL-interacting
MWQLSGPVRPTPPILSFLQMRTAWGPAVFPAPHSPPHARSSFSALWASLIHTQGVSLSHLHTKTHHTNPTRTDTRPRDTQALTIIWQHPRLTSPHPAQPQGCAPFTHNTVVSPLTSLEKETPQLWSLLSHTLSIPLPGPPHLLQHPAPPSPPETPERRPTVSSESRRDLLLGEKLVTLLQLSVLKGSPRRSSDGCTRLGLQPDLPQEGRAVAGRAGCWGIKPAFRTCSRGAPHQEAPPLGIQELTTLFTVFCPLSPLCCNCPNPPGARAAPKRGWPPPSPHRRSGPPPPPSPGGRGPGTYFALQTR